MMTRDHSGDESEEEGDAGSRRVRRTAAKKTGGSALQNLRDMRNGGNISNLKLMEDDEEIDTEGYDEYKDMYGASRESDRGNPVAKRRRVAAPDDRNKVPTGPQSHRLSTMFQSAAAKQHSSVVSKLTAGRGGASDAAGVAGGADDGSGSILSSLLADLQANPLGTSASAPVSSFATLTAPNSARYVAPSVAAKAVSGGDDAAIASEWNDVDFGGNENDVDVEMHDAREEKASAPSHPRQMQAAQTASSVPRSVVASSGSSAGAVVVKKEEAMDVDADIKPVVRAAAPVAPLVLSSPPDNKAYAADALLSPTSAAQNCTLPLTKGEDGEDVLRMYWLDAVEEYATPGVVYLFGKVATENRFVSICVSVSNIQRTVYFLPREKRVDESDHVTDEPVEIGDVYGEVQEVMNKQRIPRFLSKPVERKFAFDRDGSVPALAQYLKVKYAPEYPALSPELKGRTFSRVFGTHCTSIEQFLMKRDLMGPAWIELRDVKMSNRPISWCTFDVVVDDMKKVRKCAEQMKPPPLVVLSLSLKTVLNQKHHRNEISTISYVAHRSVETDGPTANPERDSLARTAICKLDGIEFPLDFSDALKNSREVEACANERALLSILLARIHLIDPDVLVGHNFLGFDLSVLLHRMNDLKVPHWSKLGRLRRSNMPKQAMGGSAEASFQERGVLSGRLVCDMYNTARDLIRGKSHSLTELALTQLNVDRQEVDADRIPQFYSNSPDLLRLIEHCERDAQLCMSLCHRLLVIPLTKQLTCLAGNVWSRTFIGGRAERNEHLLLHEFHRRKFICPDKQTTAMKKAAALVLEEEEEAGEEEGAPKRGRKEEKSRRRKAAYAGGLVLEPKKGFYDKFVIMLDFNSLYPSIIQEYNICFTTVAPPVEDPVTHEITKAAVVPEAGVEQGVLPKILATLVERRRQVKSLIKAESDPQRLQQLDIRQRALKLTANSMYGCLGFGHSRFYAKHLAELITLRGRDTLQKTVDLAQGALALNVIYGDTDSVMIATNSEDLAEAKRVGVALKKEVNKLYRHLEIELDGIFRTMLLLKKKKYAALVVSEVDGNIVTHKETKGLDIVRRDWCELSHDVGNYILNQILSETARENLVSNIHAYLRQVAEDVMGGRTPLDKFIINKGLTKSPEDYADKKSQPHVQVALKLKAKGRSVRPGDTVPYVICEGDDPSFAMRAHHPDDIVRSPDTLKVDFKYYLRQQVHPVVGRLCEPIEGTDAAHLAECLGLDPRAYAHAIAAAEDAQGDQGDLPAEERYRSADRWSVSCVSCGWYGEFPGVVRTENKKILCGLVCPGCQVNLNAGRLRNLLTHTMRSHIDRYYEGRMRCDEETCGHMTRSVHVCGRGRRCNASGCTGTMRREYTDAQLLTQLLYLRHLFDTEKTLKELEDYQRADANIVVQPYMDEFAAVYAMANTFVLKHARNIVDLGALFSSLNMA
eukprot:Opistho-2@70403